LKLLFKGRHLKHYLDVCFMISIRGVSVQFPGAFQKDFWEDRVSWKRTLFILFILQKHKVLMLIRVYTKKKTLC